MGEENKIDQQLFQKGINLGVAGEYQDALNVFESILTSNPETAEAWYNKASALAKLGQFEEANLSLRRFTELAPSSLASHITHAKENLKQLQSRPKRRKIIFGLIGYGIIGIIGTFVIAWVAGTQSPPSETTDAAVQQLSPLYSLYMLFVLFGCMGGTITLIWGVLWLYRLGRKDKQVGRLWLNLSDGAKQEAANYPVAMATTASISAPATYSRAAYADDIPPSSATGGGLSATKVVTFVISFFVALFIIAAIAGNATVGHALVAVAIASGIASMVKN